MWLLDKIRKRLKKKKKMKRKLWNFKKLVHQLYFYGEEISTS